MHRRSLIYRIPSLQVPLNFNFIVEVAFQAVFQSDFRALFWIFRNSNLEKPLSNNSMIIVDFFSSMVDVHLQRKKGQGQFVSNEAKRLGHVLLRHPSSIRPATVGKCLLQMTGLERISPVIEWQKARWLYNVGSYKPPSSQHVDPEAYNFGQGVGGGVGKFDREN